jgi:cellobiose phosphorylase
MKEKTLSEYGRFDDEASEYVITRPDTPLPWLNYLGCEEFFGLVSNTGGGYCFYRDARLRRLTRYRYNNVPLDSNGRYLYVKDGQRIWNPTWKPTRTALGRYECRHGLGYSRIVGECGGIEVAVTFFVPLGQTCEVWDVRVTNRTGAPHAITLFSFVEWCLWDALDDMTNFQRNFSTGQVEVEDGAIFHVTEYRERRNHFAYFACSRAVDGFDTSRNAFVGVHEGLDAPVAVLAGRCTNSLAHGWHPIGAHQIGLSLAPGQTQRMHFLLGYAENPPDAKFSSPHVANKAPYRTAARQLADGDAVDAAFARLKDYWRDLLSIYRVEIDDEHVSRMVNTWNPYQCMVTLNLSRSASGYESGIGRGMGYRDSNQDILGVAHLAPRRARQRLCDLAATQLSDGTCFHQYQPLTKKGNAEVGGGFNDDPLWLPLSVSAYIRETGDESILHEPVGYADVQGRNSTMLDHLELSLRYTDEHLGPHGLPLIGHADWNDCLNLNCFSTTPGESFQTAGDIGASQAESLMIAGQYCAAAEAMAGICEHCLADPARAEAFRAAADRMRGAILKHGWDGEWFLRAYDAQGRPIGSRQCQEGQIFIESQGWCVMGGVGLLDGKARRALDSVAERLATPNGIILQQPAYATYHVELGEVSSYPPGYKENAGIFTHNNTWIQIAETMLGRGDRAYEYYRSICPSAKQEQIDVYRCEPYCYSQMTAGPDSATCGEAKNSWLTGTASWSYVAIAQHILGVRPDFAGLVVDPCIPAAWKQYTIHRRFRGRTYHIRIANPTGVSRGVKSITANGQEIDGNLVPLTIEGAEVYVKVVMG